MMLTSTAYGLQFANGAIGLIDSGVRLGARAGVGIGDRNSAEGLPPNDPRLLPFFPVWIEESVRPIIFVSVTVRPTIHSDGLNVPRRIEARSAKHPSELITNIAFKFRKWGLHQLISPRAILLARRQTWLARSAQHEQDHGFFRLARKVILAETNGKIEHGITVVTPRRSDVAHAQLVERSPILNRHMRVD